MNKAKNHIPKYYQLAEKLADEIKAGNLNAGDQLPPEDVFAKQLEVNRKTLRRSLEKLEIEGYITRQKGKGTFITDTLNRKRIIYVLLSFDMAFTNRISVSQLLNGVIFTTTQSNFEMRMITGDMLPPILEQYKAGCGDICGFVLLCYRPHMAPLADMISNLGLPMLLEGYQHPTYNYLTVDNITPMHDAIDHLYNLGHRKIGIITFKDKTIHSDYLQREEALIEALASHDIPLDPKNCFEAPSMDFDPNLEAAEAYFSEPPQATAWAAISDYLSVSFIKGARKQGYSVPDDFSVTGFGNIAEIAFFEPKITTFYQDYYSHGKSATAKLIELTSDFKHGRYQIELKPNFIPGESCQPLSDTSAVLMTQTLEASSEKPA